MDREDSDGRRKKEYNAGDEGFFVAVIYTDSNAIFKLF